MSNQFVVVACSLRFCKEQFHEFRQSAIVDQDSTGAFVLKNFINPAYLEEVVDI